MLRLENIKQMRHKKNCGRKLSHWTYTEIYAKLEDKCLEEGVLLSKISPTYTSIRCSVCGWTRVRNRKRELFKCGQCGFTSNSDLNASKNIGANLIFIPYEKRHRFDAKNGFFWHETCGKELVVPYVKDHFS